MPHRDVSASAAAYRPYNEEYASVQRRVDRPAPPEPDPERKKDKKWSIGKLFRRKKKEEESTSSESDEGVSTKSPSKRKSKKKKKTPAVNNFDHIVIRDSRRAQSLAKSKLRDASDDGVLSDPSAGFINYRAKTQELYGASKESLSLRDDTTSRSGKSLLEAPSRKTRKGRLKARVEALRNSLKGESSSEEESSLKSSNSSSMIRFRSEDSLMRSRDSSLNKRSRSARNERYIKRLSRDDENQLNKEAELLQQGYTKAEVELLTRTPTSQSSGYGTCKRDQTNIVKQEQLYANEATRRPMKSESISSFPSTTQSYPSSINFNAKVNNEHINYSIQYPSNNTNHEKETLYANTNRERSVSNHYESPEKVMCVKFPLGNVTNVKREEKAPPVPPPRDMQRKVTTPLSMYYENNPIIMDRINHSNNKVVHGVPNNDFERIMRRSQERSSHNGFNGLRRPISNSEDHIAMQNNEYIQSFQYKSEQPRRPASVSAEPNHYGIYVNSSPWRKQNAVNNIVKPEPVQVKNDFLYYADESPRSRRPISIKNSQNRLDNQYLSDSQASLNVAENVYRKPRNASDFWRKIDDAERQRRNQNIYANSRSSSDFTNTPLSRTSSYIEPNKQRQDKNDILNKNKPSFRSASIDTTDDAKMWKATTEYKRSITVEPPKAITSPTTKTHVRHKSDTFIPSTCQMTSDDEKSSERRKSTNLDDALNELEAIYNSLGLGDEDLLDRAERRELMTPKYNDHFNDWNGNDDEVQLRSQPTTPLRRVPRRSTLPDKLQDDMAFRRMNSFNKDKPNNHKEGQAQISYMLASPVFVPYASDDDRQSERNEPDIVYDDVVYRNIKQTNSRLKTLDPQPPFGIPIGPVSPAPQSDYLHAVPETKGRSRFVPRRSPDIVSDDLAYRSLRKDHRHSLVFNGEDYSGHLNNNHNSYNEISSNKESAATLKKKRAVRSLSANIFTMIQKEIDEALNMSKEATIQKTQSNSDVMKRLRGTFENNDIEKDHYPRNKVKQRHNTVNLFVNNIHAPSHNFAKDDSFIHNGDKHLAKPPSCDKSKSSSPSNRSPQASKRSSKDEFQHVLSLLAQEAMDTSNKLGVALAELDKNRNATEKKSDVQARISDSRLSFLNGLTEKSDDPQPEIKVVSVRSEVVYEPKEEQNMTKGNKDSKAKKTEDSLLAISDQLHRVEDQLKHSFEKELNVEDESLKLSYYISNADQRVQEKAQETTVLLPENKLIPDVIPLTVQNDSSKIENRNDCKNNAELKPKSPEMKSTNPFLNMDDKIKEINEINAFKELKDGISDLIAGITQVNEKLFLSKGTKTENNNPIQDKVSGITEASEKLNQATQNVVKQEVPNRASVNLSIYEDDLEIKRDAADSTEYNSSEELATIFKLDSSKKSRAAANENNNEDEKKIREELSSPKLVQTMNQQLRRLSVDNTDDCTPSQSNSLPNNAVPWRAKRQNHNSQKENRGTWSTIMHGVRFSF